MAVYIAFPANDDLQPNCRININYKYLINIIETLQYSVTRRTFPHVK